MKQHLYLLALVAISFSACGPVYLIHQDPVPTPPTSASPADPDDLTYQNFYDQLSPYGQWIEDPNYGYVWLPDAGSDFKPYSSNGHWVYTDEGWTWDSGYPWGWAAFHYGRWFFQDGYGWMWMPGTEWAPAWVSWRNSDEYYGWAPMGPNVSFDAAYGGYAPPTYYWNFVPHRYISSPQVNNYYVRETNNVTIINQTTVIRNTTVMNRPRNSRYGGGPDPGEVGRYSGTAVRPLAIRESHTPGERADNGNLTIYRPRVNGGDNNRPGSAGRPFAPSRTQKLNNTRPVNRTVYGDNTGSNNGSRDDRGNGDRNTGDRDNGGRTNAGFPNNAGNPVNQPVNPQASPNNPPASRPVPPANQPDNRFGRPSQPNNRPNQQQPQSVPNAPDRQQPAPNQPARQQPVRPQPVNQQQPAPNQQRPVFNRPAQQQPAPAQQQPIQSRQQQSPPSQPAAQPVMQRPMPGRPANTMPAGRPFNPQQTNPTQPRPVVNSPKPESKPATPPPPKKDESGRPGRS